MSELLSSSAQLIVRGKLYERTARGKLVVTCDYPGCVRRFLARTREESLVVLFLRATYHGWTRLGSFRGIVLCPRCKEVLR